MSATQEAAEEYKPNWSMNDWLAFQREWAEQKRKCDVENGVLRNIVKRGKNQGLPTDLIGPVQKLRRREKPEAELYLNQMLRIVAANGIVSGPQLNLWAQQGYEPNKEDADLATLAQAEQTGFEAGRGGSPKDANPYPIGTEASVAWVKWWNSGVAAQRRATGGASVVASRQQPKARGRKQLALKALPAPEPKPKQTLARDNVVPIPKRGRGRPPGARNKPKKGA